MIGHNGGPAWGSEGGWIAIARVMRDHDLVGFHLFANPDDPTKGALQPALAFIDLIMECRYEDGHVVNGGRKMAIRRGEMLGAISWLAARWNWTPRAVRSWIDRLEEANMVVRFARDAAGKETETSKGNRSGNQTAFIRLCNYDKFQAFDSQLWQAQSNGQSIRQSERNQTGNQISEPSTLNIKTKDELQVEHGQSNLQSERNQSDNQLGNKQTKERNKYIPAPPDPGLLPLGTPEKVSLKSVAHEAFVEWQAFAKVHNLACPKDTSFKTYAEDIKRRLLEQAESKTRTGMLDVWNTALCFVAKSKFLRGMSGDFKADLGMILRPKNFAKLIAGGYGNGAAALDSRWLIRPASAPGESLEAIAIRRQREEALLAAEGWETARGDP